MRNPPSAVARQVAAALLLVASRALAQGDEPSPEVEQLDLEALMALRVDDVSSVSKHLQSIASAPASVTVITRDEIRDLGYRTLAEALNGVRGVFTTYDRNYTYLGFRGFERGDYNTRILLLVDGHTWNEDVYDMAFIGPEFGVDLDLVERIEIARGPGSSIYGGNALFGTVNVVTRRPESLGRGEVAASGGSFGAYGGRATVAYAGRDAEGLLSLSGNDVRGQDLWFPEFASTPSGGWARGQDWERWGSFLGKATWRGWTLEVLGVRRDKGVPTGSFGAVFDDPHNQTTDRRLSAELRRGWTPTPSIDVHARAYFDAYAFGEGYAYATATGAPPTINHDDDQGRWIGTEVRTLSRLGGGWLLVAGAEAKLHLLQQLWNFDENGPVNLLARRSAAAGSLYAQLEAPLTPWLQATAGVRYDRVGSIADELSPRLALVVSPWSGTTVKALYGRAFRPPNYAELRYANAEFWEPATSLHPEHIATYELAVEQRFSSGLQLAASGYRYDVEGLVSATTDPVTGMGTYTNADAARATGVELEAQQRFSSGVAVRASWAIQRAEDAATGARLTNSPTSLAKVHLHGPLGFWHLRAGAELLYMSSRLTLGGATASDHLLLDLHLLAAGVASGALDVGVGLRNALGTGYGDPGYDVQDQLRQDGRSLRVTATWRF